MSRTPTRRQLLTAAGALGLGAALTACGADDPAPTRDTGPGASGPWSFEDDRGETVTADRAPATLVAFTGTAAALHDYGVTVQGVFGPTRTADGKPDVQAGDLDIGEVTILGNEWGQFNIEKYAALAPDLLISTMYDDRGTLWYVPDESRDKILAVGAPTVGISVYDRLLTGSLERMAALAASLGADLKATEVAAAKKRFEDAAARLRAAAAAKPDIKVLVGSAAADMFYVSGSNLSVDLEYFASLGVNFVEPPASALAETGGWFETLSWENVNKYPADLILMDNRTSAIQPADITEGTWKQLPAVKAGQVLSRDTEPILSYAKCEPMLTALAEALEGAERASGE
ncbi:ABC transporter substrate-binding protein [Streptomyces sp. NPDC004610]|uniref:ABC transporter substrate-binding protein n=1 Tax=unclassified Streptomyces TaxID=2593676 RepID=UPI0033A63A9F